MIECDYGVFHDTVLVGLGIANWRTNHRVVCCQSEPISFFFFFFSFFLLVRLFGPLRSVDDPTLVSRILPFVGWSEMICFLFRLLRVYCHRGVIILYIAQ